MSGRWKQADQRDSAAEGRDAAGPGARDKS